MELFYCDACGLRIKSGDGRKGPDEQRYCDACFAKQFPGVAVPKPTTPLPGSQRTTAVFASPVDSSRRKAGRAEVAHPERSSKPNSTLIAAGGGGAAALLLIGFLIFGRGSKDESVARAEPKPPAPPAAPAPAESARRLVDVAPPAAAEKKSTTPAFKPVGIVTPTPPSAPPQQLQNKSEPDRTPATVAPPAAVAPEQLKRLATPEESLARKQEDFQESYARRQLDELLAHEQKGTMPPAEIQKRVGDLAKGYASTAAGRDAAAKLKALMDAGEAAARDKAAAAALTAQAGTEASPAEQAQLLLGGGGPPEAAPAAADAAAPRVIWQNNFESADQWKIVEGQKETVQANGVAGQAVKSEPRTSGYFVGAISLKFAKAGPPVKLGANSWVKFSYRLQGVADFCFHVSIGDSVYEKYLFGPKVGKWSKASFRLTEFSKCITKKNESQPPPNSDLNALTMFLGSQAGPATVIVDDVLIGDGPIPED